MSLPTCFERDFLMACRYGYYVCGQSVLPDWAYDAEEHRYHKTHPRLPVGSSLAADYTAAQRALYLYLMLSGRSAAAVPPQPVYGEELL